MEVLCNALPVKDGFGKVSKFSPLETPEKKTCNISQGYSKGTQMQDAKRVYPNPNKTKLGTGKSKNRRKNSN